jgi:hypothetical protein
MNILLTAGTGGSQFVRRGWCDALNAIGHKTMGFYPFDKPPFRVFDEHKPEVFFCGADEITKAIYKCIQNNPKLAVGVWVNPEDDENLIAELVNEQRRLVVFAQTTPKFLEYFAKWTERFKVVAVPPGCESIQAGKFENALNCKASYVGFYSDVKLAQINKYILPLCEKYKTKIFGYGNWPVVQHLGFIPNELLPALYTSSHVSVCLAKNDSPYYIDESVFRVLSGGGCPAVEHTDAAQDLFGIHAKYFNTFEGLCSIINNNATRFDSLKSFLEENSYRERVIKALTALDIA